MMWDGFDCFRPPGDERTWMRSVELARPSTALAPHRFKGIILHFSRATLL